MVSTLLVSFAVANAGPPPELFRARLSLFTGLPDLTSVSVSFVGIPHLELEVGAGLLGIFPTAYVRAGPRLLYANDRDPEDFRGWTRHASILVGPRTFGGGWAFNFALTQEWTYWVMRHLGFTLQLVGGGIFPNGSSDFWPDVRFAFGLAF